MAIRMVEDLGAPIAVTAVDLITLETAPDWNEWASYLMAAGGYVGGFMGFGGPFVKQIGVASLPLAARNIRERMRGGASKKVAERRMNFRPARQPVSGNPISASTRVLTPQGEEVIASVT